MPVVALLLHFAVIAFLHTHVICELWLGFDGCWPAGPWSAPNLDGLQQAARGQWFCFDWLFNISICALHPELVWLVSARDGSLAR